MKLKPCLVYALFKTLFLFSNHLAFAQNNNTSPIVFDLKKMKPTSPEAAMLGRFGEVPIGFYNGTANISVPLYTINVGALQIPITLSYHNSGVKVEDEATWVGLGWSLEPGGAVIKSVVGGDDDLFSNLRDQDPTGYDFMIGRSVTGYFSQSQTVGHTLWNCFPDPCGSMMITLPPDESQPILVKLLQGDGQPDIFQYSLPNGLSGKFYFNPQTQLPVLINKETELKIIYSKSLEQFDLVTLSGDKYTFSALEKSYAGTVTDFTGKTWKLAKITLSDGRIVDFTYTNGKTYQYSWSESYHSTYPWSTSNNSNLFDYNLDVNTSETKYLKQIVAPQVIITFNHEDRQDLPCTNDNDNDNTNGTLSVKRLRSVDIIDRATGRLIKSFQFSYSYFGNSTVGGSYRTNTSTQQNEWLSRRLRLDSLREIGYTPANQPIYQPAYKFDYNNTVLLPLKSSYARDFWGYYNGKNNSRLLPNMYYFYYSNFVEYNNIPASVMNAYSGADRSTDSSKLQAAMLKQITYPTGGYTKFEYEPNEFTNYTYPDLTKLSNLQQSVFVKDQNNSYDTKTTTFTPTTSQTLQFTNVITRGPSSPTQSLTFYDLLPSKITLKKIVSGTATTVKEWQMNSLQQQEFNTNGSVTWLNDTVSVIANVTYSISVELPDAVGAQNMAMKQAAVTSSFSYYTQPTGNYKLSYGAGIRLKSMTNYSAPAVLTNRKNFKYSLTDGSSSGLLMSPLKFLYWREMLGSFVDGTQPNCATYTALDRVWFISSQSFVPYSTSASGNLVGYSRVEEWDVDAAGIAKGKNIYMYHNQPSDTKINNPDNPDLLNGKLLTQVTLNAANDTLQKVDNIYLNLFSTAVSYTGIKLFSNFVNADPCGAIGPHYNGPEPSDMGKWDINFYPINSRWYVPVQTTTQTYEGGKVARNTKYLFYNEKGQLSKDSTFNSKAQSIVQRYKYPIDINVAQRTATEQALIDSSFYDSMLEYRTFANNGETGLTKASYGVVNNRLVRTKIEKSYGGGPLADEALFTAYGTNKNVTEVKDKGGKSHSLVWDRTNTSILAMVENASLKDVAYSSFEVDQLGNWTIGSSSRQQGGYTGKQAYSLANGSLSRSGLTAGITYVLTYWTTSSTPLNITGTVGTPSNLAQVNGWRQYQHNITAVSTVTLSGSILVDEVRLYPKDAQMTTYTYEPLIGITSVTDPKGEVTFYEYDEFNRLKNIKDAEGNILKNYCYNYAGQQTGCPVITALSSNVPITYQNWTGTTAKVNQLKVKDGSGNVLYTFSTTNLQAGVTIPRGTYTFEFTMPTTEWIMLGVTLTDPVYLEAYNNGSTTYTLNNVNLSNTTSVEINLWNAYARSAGATVNDEMPVESQEATKEAADVKTEGGN